MKTVADLIANRATEYANYRNTLWTHREALDGILEELREKVEIVHITAGWGVPTIRVSGDKDVLTTCIRIFRRYGVKAWSAPEENSPEYSAFFTPEEAPDTDLFLFSFTSTVCKRVRVGTETREVPIYEVRCEGGE
jgi:hypothetical protein